jgi:lysyl-tRNA synthetase class 2
MNITFWNELADYYQRETHIATDDFHFGPLLPGEQSLGLLPAELEGLHCLEIGCGAAQNSLYLAQRGARCVACDGAEQQLKHARRLAAELQCQLELHCCDLEELPLPPERLFDLVHSSHALAFANDQMQALRTWAARVKPGGSLILSTVHPLAGSEWLDLDEDSGAFVKDYFHPAAEERESQGGNSGCSRAQPISAIVQCLADCGLLIDRVLEPRPPNAVGRKLRDLVPYWSPAWEAHTAELAKVPYTIIVRAKRPRLDSCPGAVPSVSICDRPDPAAAAKERQDLAARRDTLALRARVFAGIRDFFERADFLEVHTPIRIETPALEDYIDAKVAGTHWLRTSPELHMKRLLAAGYERIYQLGACFRAGESGQRHRGEFTMLEWYRSEAGWRQVLDDCVRLFQHLAQSATGSQQCSFRGQLIDLALPWEELSVEAAFRRYADLDLDEVIAAGRFEEVLVEKVEPRLGIGRPTILSEYPLACSGLSQPIAGRPNRVERWELYAAGLELGNACSELIDPAEQYRRFVACAELRAREKRVVYPLDQPFMDALRAGMPASAGVAVGVDRVVMLLSNAKSIDEVNAF